MKLPKYMKEENGDIIVEIKVKTWPSKWTIKILTIAAQLRIIKQQPKWLDFKVIDKFPVFWIIPIIKRNY